MALNEKCANLWSRARKVTLQPGVWGEGVKQEGKRSMLRAETFSGGTGKRQRGKNEGGTLTMSYYVGIPSHVS